MTENIATEPDEMSGDAIAAFRSKGNSGATARLIADRHADDNTPAVTDPRELLDTAPVAFTGMHA
ncbi:hypothetical protein [Nevskia sp.]|uniref:hypothetical protein n=1 Tax=Nevskia sp. TaxID=1929292 RepID=UPI0025EEDC15|nr:hypothetical protein [Nevskia sp.]